MTQEDLGLFLGRPSETVEEATRAGEEAAERQRQRDRRPRRRAAAEPTLTPQDILNLLAAGELSATEAIERLSAIFEGQGTDAQAALQNAQQMVGNAQVETEALQQQALLTETGQIPGTGAISDNANPFLNEQTLLQEIEGLNDPAASAFIPQIREGLTSESFTGRQGLFGDVLSRSLPAGLPSFIGQAASNRFPFLNALFQFSQATGGDPTQTLDIPGIGETDISNSFTNFVNSLQGGALGTLGGVRGGLGNLANILNTNPQQLQETNPFAFDLRQQLVENPSQAFRFINPALSNPTLGRLGNVFGSARSNVFQRFQANNPQFSGVDIINQFLGGDIPGLAF